MSETPGNPLQPLGFYASALRAVALQEQTHLTSPACSLAPYFHLYSHLCAELIGPLPSITAVQ